MSGRDTSSSDPSDRTIWKAIFDGLLKRPRPALVLDHRKEGEMTEVHDGARFVWRDHDLTSYGNLGGALCRLETPDDAADLWDAYVGYLGRPTARLGGQTAHEVAASNIGYLMGYYGPEDRERVYGLFPMASHPIFGRMEAAK